MDEAVLVKENKPRLPVWARLVLVIISFIVFGAIFSFIGMIVVKVPLSQMSDIKNLNPQQLFIIQLFNVLSLMLVVFFFRRVIDRESFISLGFSLKNGFKDILLGFLVALSIMGGGSLILYGLHYIDFSNVGMGFYSLFISFLMFIAVALNEEMLTRGYILNNLMTSMNKYWALVVSAVIFALFHSLNSNLSLLAMVNLFLAGVLLGATYIFTKNLWFPISLHLFWNFFQGPILGYSVSGQKTESIFKVNLTGNSSINGGEFGFEGSMVCTIMLVMAIGLILFYFRRKLLKEQLSIANCC